MWLVLSLQLVRFYTLTFVSQQAETMIGFCLLGEKWTQETQPWWLSSWIVYHSWGGDALCTGHNKQSSP
jgi:hypothetical protein